MPWACIVPQGKHAKLSARSAAAEEATAASSRAGKSAAAPPAAPVKTPEQVCRLPERHSTLGVMQTRKAVQTTHTEQFFCLHGSLFNSPQSLASTGTQ